MKTLQSCAPIVGTPPSWDELAHEQKRCGLRRMLRG